MLLLASGLGFPICKTRQWPFSSLYSVRRKKPGMSALERQGLFHQRRGWGSPGVQIGPHWPPGWGQGPCYSGPVRGESPDRALWVPRVRQQLSVGPLGTWFQPMLSSHCDYDLGPWWASVFPSMKWGQCRSWSPQGPWGPGFLPAARGFVS